MDENKLRLLTVMTACLFFVFAFGLIGSLIMLLRSDSHAQMKLSAESGMNPGNRVNAMDPSIIISGKRGVSAVKVSDLRFEIYDQESDKEHHQDTAPSPTPASFEKCPSGAPGSNIKFLIAIMSECCNMASRRKRDAIRQTWLRDAMREHGDVLGVKFLLSTPKVSGEDDIAKYQKLLRDEVSATAAADGMGDIVLFSDALETYDNLPLKTIEIMRYMKVSSCAYTHVLKVDDDVYARMNGVLAIVGYKAANWHIKYDHMPQEQMSKVYRGFVGNKLGFQAERDPQNKWYLTYNEWPRDTKRVPYASGWAYVLSRDLGEYVVRTMDRYQHAARTDDKKILPPYYTGMMKLEDVMVGYILDEMHVKANHAPAFKPGHIECHQNTIVKHLDIDAPFLMPVLAINDKSGLWKHRTIQCNSGDSIGTFDKYYRFPMKHKKERVRELERETPETMQLEYTLYPLVEWH